MKFCAVRTCRWRRLLDRRGSSLFDGSFSKNLLPGVSRACFLSAAILGGQPAMTRWVEETLHDHFRFRFKADEVFFESQTEHQHLIIFHNQTFGRVMLLDGVIQVTEADEYVYHETMSHFALFALGAERPRKVLIIGGGDGGVLREVLRHEAVEKAVLCEIDRSVIDLSRQYLPDISRSTFDNPRAEIVISDGTKLVAETEELFDAIIVDSTDPIGPGKVLFTREFYADCKRALALGGVLITQQGLPFAYGWELEQSAGYFRELYADWAPFMIHVPTYIGGPMALAWASDDRTLRETPLELLQERFARAGLEMKYYTPELHKGAFAVPAYVKKLAGIA
jgi:spermidine synthase